MSEQQTTHQHHPAPQACPVCSGELHLRRLACQACGTEVSGHFRAAAAWGLEGDQVIFLRDLLAARGDLARAGAIRGHDRAWAEQRLDALLATLGIAPSPEPTTPQTSAPDPSAPRTSAPAGRPSRDEVLALVAAGRMDPSDAAVLLSQE